MAVLNRLIASIEASGGSIEIRDGHLTIRGTLPGPVLMQAHRHRRRLERLLARSKPGQS